MVDVQVGDLVLTSDLAQLPERPSHRHGKAGARRKRTSQHVEIIPAVDFNHLEEVLVITPYFSKQTEPTMKLVWYPLILLFLCSVAVYFDDLNQPQWHKARISG
jgi:hypothetical protein